MDIKPKYFLTGFIGFFLSASFRLPAIASSSEAGGDEADRKQFAYGEGKMSSLEEG
ncbi:hypothetical protein ACFLZE_00125 [Thermodesulfobacteriota bacterium]